MYEYQYFAITEFNIFCVKYDNVVLHHLSMIRLSFAYRIHMYIENNSYKDMSLWNISSTRLDLSDALKFDATR